MFSFSEQEATTPHKSYVLVTDFEGGEFHAHSRVNMVIHG